ncbi:MAG: hypothetical protein AAGA57_08820 [Planctomycetota bacterium]
MPVAAAESARRADAFLAEARLFQLGDLLTEQQHPKTVGLAEAAGEDLSRAVSMIHAVDQDLPSVMADAIVRPQAVAMGEAILRSLRAGRKVFFTGCGATGRLSLLLESAWRNACAAEPAMAPYQNRVFGVMAGGDFALIKSVEGYEDFAAFGARQIGDLGVEAGDTVVAITEGGETTFVIGTAHRGVEAGAETYFVYNNPDDRLRPVARSAAILDDDRIGKLNLTTGPMAVAGSTRMQATTIQLAVVGAILERSWSVLAGGEAEATSAYVERFARIVEQLEDAPARSAMVDLAQREAELYQPGRGGRVLYRAMGLLLDVMTDTTERSPTFSLPPFRKQGDAEAPLSWSFVKDPTLATPEAWAAMMGRPVRGIEWTAQDYRDIGAPADVAETPPELDRATIERFEIGREPEDGPFDLRVGVCGRARGDGAVQAGADVVLCVASAPAVAADPGATVHHLPEVGDDGPLRWGERLQAKIVLNTLSTASMAATGRLVSNWMVHVRCSNKKLIDRGIRLLRSQVEIDYDTACRRLFDAIVELENAPPGESAESPVALTLRRLRSERG